MVAKLAGVNESATYPPLHAAVTGEGPPVLLLHGLFGMGSNLGGIARALAPDYSVHQLDLPNHGRSPWVKDGDVCSLADAIRAYIDNRVDEPVAVLGHSLGGKVAMQLALRYPARVSALIVADIAPIAYPASHDAVFAGIEAVALARPSSRREAGEILRRDVHEDGVRQFLLLSLQRDPGGAYVWRFNAEGLREHYEALRAAPAGEPYTGPALFVYGGESDYMPEEGKQAAGALFRRAEFRSIPDTGHWLHAEKPEEFNQIVTDFLRTHSRTRRVVA
jgi:esterase